MNTATATTNKRPLRISDLEEKRVGSVWVCNRTKGQNRSIINLSVPRAHGRGSDNVNIPITFLPIDLTGQVPKGDLLQSSQFRRAVSSGALLLVSDEDAQKMLEQPGAQEELERLAREAGLMEAESARMTSGAEPEEAEQPEFSARIVQFLANLEDATNPVTVLNTLRSMDELREDEWRAISKAVEQRRGFEDVQNYCEQQIANLG